jgi:hypothetical protein
MKYFLKVDCVETVDGILLTWVLRDGVIPKSFIVCGTNKNRTWEIKSPVISTCRCMIKADNDGLSSLYSVKVQTMDGGFEESSPLQPQALEKVSRRLLKEIKRRELTMYKSHPFGAYDAVILLKRQIGKPCSVCGSGRCIGHSGVAIDPSCPVCLGTGLDHPYFVYPKTEKMLGVPAKDDKVTGTAGVQRLVVEQMFRTVFSGVIREDDIVIIGNEAYVVLDSSVQASVGNAPVVYQLACSQLMPEDPKHQAIHKLITGDADVK